MTKSTRSQLMAAISRVEFMQRQVDNKRADTVTKRRLAQDKKLVNRLRRILAEEL
jgi:hypothetical protein